MKFTPRQINDLQTIEYFIPEVFKNIVLTDKDRMDFLATSERGVIPPYVAEKKYNAVSGWEALKEGKRWRGIHMEMYEEGVLDGTMPYVVILENMPRAVVDFMKKEMFKRIDAAIIEQVYQDLSNHGGI